MYVCMNLQGIIFLHASEIKSHGKLKSSNCVGVGDSRWVVKITDFGLHEFMEGEMEQTEGEHALYRSKCRSLWNLKNINILDSENKKKLSIKLQRVGNVLCSLIYFFHGVFNWPLVEVKSVE